MIWLTSDNAGPMAPEVLAALTAANAGYCPSYGAEAAMDRVTARLRAIFEAPDAVVHLVSTGTTANCLALGCLTDPWGAALCHEQAHVEMDECGAPGFYMHGAKLSLLPGAAGRIDAAVLAARLARADPSVHGAPFQALSLTNATELGAVYRPEQVAELSRIAHAHGLGVHMDGARFTNALVSCGATPAELSWRAGVDVLSFGGTKNGLMGVEAVIFFDPTRAASFERRRKQGGHLFSKHRFLSAQMEAYLADDLWLRLARHANRMAARLEVGLSEAGYAPLYPREANMLFVQMPRAVHRQMEAAGMQYYLWPHSETLDGADEAQIGCRLVCGWSTTEADVDGFLAALPR